MIRLAEDTPANVVIAEASGKVTSEDYEQMLLPAIQRATEGGDKVRFLYVLGADFDGYQPEALMDDAKLGLQHWTDFERIGLVTDSDAYRVMVKAFGFLMPGQVRVFSVADREEARAWITGD